MDRQDAPGAPAKLTFPSVPFSPSKVPSDPSMLSEGTTEVLARVDTELGESVVGGDRPYVDERAPLSRSVGSVSDTHMSLMEELLKNLVTLTKEAKDERSVGSTNVGRFVRQVQSACTNLTFSGSVREEVTTWLNLGDSKYPTSYG